MTNLSEKSYVNVGLMVTIIIGVWYLSGRLATIETRVNQTGIEMLEMKEWQKSINNELHTNKDLKNEIITNQNEIKDYITGKE